ncbi:MAG: ERCC4 domain-containing protein [Candidatus Micrarchaeota archaeon]
MDETNSWEKQEIAAPIETQGLESNNTCPKKHPVPNLELLLDDRELKSPLAKLLFSKGVKLHPKRLEVADFIISEQIAIERKTAEDFESSIMDGRLFSQCKDLSANFQSPLICIVGREFTHLHSRAIIGAQISIATDYRIPLFHFDSEEGLAEFIHILLVQKSQLPKDMKLRFEKKSLPKDDQLQMVLEGVQMIGPVHAKSILRQFKTLKKVFSASEKSLQKVEGVGEARAKQIAKTANAIYGEEDREQQKFD